MEYINSLIHSEDIKPVFAAGLSSFFQCTLFYWCEVGKNNAQAGNKNSFSKIIKYRGYSTALVYMVLSRSLGFGMFEFIKNISIKNFNLTETRSLMLSALITGFIKPIILFPIETIKINIQVNNLKLREAFNRMHNLKFKIKLEALLYLQIKNITSYYTWFETRKQLKEIFVRNNKRIEQNRYVDEYITNNDISKICFEQDNSSNNINNVQIFQKKQKNKIVLPFYQTFVIGSVSSCLSFLVSSPFSTLKTLRQIGNYDSINSLFKKGGSTRFHKGFLFHITNIIGGGGVFNVLYTKLS